MLFFIILLIPVTLILMLVGVKYWRETVIAVLIWSLLEGVARKWLLPSLQAPILQMKDIALIAVYIGYMISPKTPLPEADKVKVLSTVFLVQAIYCFLEVLNPALPTPLLGFYGLKTYIIYVPLVFVIPEVIRTREHVQKLVLWTCIASIPISLLGLYQFSQPATSWVNQYVSHEEGVASVASMFGKEEGTGDFMYGRARTASTFSYIGGFITYLLAAVPLAGSVLFRTNVPQKTVWCAIAAVVLLLGGAFTTGSRTTIVVFAAVIPLSILIAGSKGLIPLATTLRLGATTLLMSAATLLLFSGAASAFWYRANNADSTTDRLASPFTELIDSIPMAPLLGTGIGSNSNAGSSIVDSSYSWLPYVVEGEPSRVLQDLGIGGFAIVYLMKILVCYLCVKWLFWSRSKLFVATYLACACFLLPNIVITTINNPTGGLYYWSFAGLALAMYRMERAERRAAEERATAPRVASRPQEPATA